MNSWHCMKHRTEHNSRVTLTKLCWRFKCADAGSWCWAASQFWKLDLKGLKRWWHPFSLLLVRRFGWWWKDMWCGCNLRLFLIHSSFSLCVCHLRLTLLKHLWPNSKLTGGNHIQTDFNRVHTIMTSHYSGRRLTAIVQRKHRGIDPDPCCRLSECDKHWFNDDDVRAQLSWNWCHNERTPISFSSMWKRTIHLHWWSVER